MSKHELADTIENECLTMEAMSSMCSAIYDAISYNDDGAKSYACAIWLLGKLLEKSAGTLGDISEQIISQL